MRKTQMARNGFTLIELLIVVAIIGTLATIVLASTSGARNRGTDTALEGDLSSIQTQATLYFDIGDTYGATNTSPAGNCALSGTLFHDPSVPTGSTIIQAIAYAQKNAGGAAGLVCRSQSSGYMVSGKLSDGNWWCVDNLGAAKELTTLPAGVSCAS